MPRQTVEARSFKDESTARSKTPRSWPGKQIREEIEEDGYAGGKTIPDDYLREVHPRCLPPRGSRLAQLADNAAQLKWVDEYPDRALLYLRGKQGSRAIERRRPLCLHLRLGRGDCPGW